MNNDYIVEKLDLGAKLMELHGQNEFKIRGLAAAVFSLDKTAVDLSEASLEEIAALQSVGKSTAAKIGEIRDKGSFDELDKLLADTPEGVVQMFYIKGIGPKKVRSIWQELQITDIHELLIACENGEVAKLKGFGDKIQAGIKESILFSQSKASKLRMDKGAILAQKIAEQLESLFPKLQIVGDIIRKNEEVDLIQIVIECEHLSGVAAKINQLENFYQNEAQSSPFIWRGSYADNLLPIELIFAKPEAFLKKCLQYSAAEEHLNTQSNGKYLLQYAEGAQVKTEEDIYKKAGLSYIVPEMREGRAEFEWAEKYKNEDLVTWADLKGIIHNHSTYSDGIHTLEQMASYCKELGFEYFGIADHSKTATYAKGLVEERVDMQHREIDALNAKLAPFKILKGIESDILGDGSLDYAPDVLASFDYVVASVHSNLKMTEEKAMSRLLRAIENPYTTVLGHPTGRLLLEREGYPVNHKVMIDACAANGVVIEINASPYRLDMDWRWIHYAMEKGVMLSINPDAHKMEGFLDMHFGLANARKGGLVKSMTFNALSLIEMEAFLAKRKR